MKKRTLLIAIISLIYTIIHSQPLADVYGLLTPIQLTDTTTEVLLEDYFKFDVWQYRNFARQ